MKKVTGASWLFIAWAAVVILIGSALISFHQPFQAPSGSILTLAKQPVGGQWQVLHVLSGSCGCSQKVMQHLLKRHPFYGMAEQVLIIDGDEPYLPESNALLAQLRQKGFPVTHIAAKNIPQSTGLYGVPLLVVALPDSKIAYMGGYGNRGDQDGEILQQIRSGQAPRPLAVRGCAIGARLRRTADPFHLKY